MAATNPVRLTMAVLSLIWRLIQSLLSVFMINIQEEVMKTYFRLSMACLFVFSNLVLGTAGAEYKSVNPDANDINLLKSWVDGPEPVYLINVFSTSCKKVIRNNNVSDEGQALIHRGSQNLTITAPWTEMSGPNKGKGSGCFHGKTDHRIYKRLDFNDSPIAFYMKTAKSVCLVPIMYISPFGQCQFHSCSLRAPEGLESLFVTKSKVLADYFRDRLSKNTEYNRRTGLPPKDC